LNQHWEFHRKKEASMYVVWESQVLLSIGTPFIQMEASKGHKRKSFWNFHTNIKELLGYFHVERMEFLGKFHFERMELFGKFSFSQRDFYKLEKGVLLNQHEASKLEELSWKFLLSP
jgi:hypothetical protein